MLPLDSPLWAKLQGGYKVPYDASDPLRRLFAGEPPDDIWEELWEELIHQGDLDQASYAAVPHLVEYVRNSSKLDWNPLGLIASVELERPNDNPQPLKELAEDYFSAVRSLPALLGNHPDQNWSEPVMQWAAACIALSRGQPWLAQAYSQLDRDTAGQWFSAEFGWEFPDTEPGS